MTQKNAEAQRLTEAREQNVPWRKWGPYLSERQWGTVREDYSSDGNAWNYFSHEQSRSRAYRWGEDGIAGFSDDQMQLCFALGLWNGRDPILKERLYGLTNSEGNHGEDVKEYYFYIDSTPTHSYMKMLYKYPQAAFPYEALASTNRNRSRQEFEYELMDTGVFDQDRYFDIFVEYAKDSPEDTLIQISAANRGPDPAELHLLPQLWFRNTWWKTPGQKLPLLTARDSFGITAHSPELGERTLLCEGKPELLFTNNESNLQRLFGQPNPSAYVKDAFHEYLINGRHEAVNPQHQGTKAAAHYKAIVPPGETWVVRLRLTNQPPSSVNSPSSVNFQKTFDARRHEADDYYATIIPPALDADANRVVRQALSGMLWSKQVFIYELDRWLAEHGTDPQTGTGGNASRNRHWFHMTNQDVISMPDKWEYPWFASWDLAFHTIALSRVDPDFALQQLRLVLQQRYIHPNGQLPAYEWNFDDVNPPVHAWATLFNCRFSAGLTPQQSTRVMREMFNRLLSNFTWWVNRKDSQQRNVFEGGFLGLDNISVFDRNSPLPTGGMLEQADGTAWMGLFTQNMLDIALTLSMEDSTYLDQALKFFEHFIWIASSMNREGGMWDEQDGFYYDLIRWPDGRSQRLQVRSMVGLLPLCATTVYPETTLERVPETVERAKWLRQHRPELFENIHIPGTPGVKGRHMLALLNENKLRRVLSKLLDPNEFLGDYGIRSLSKYHEAHPYTWWADGQAFSVRYLPSESDTGMFGGNSNWRGPIWMPVNILIIRALVQLYSYYGDAFKIECPVGSGKFVTLFEAAKEIANRLSRIFLKDEQGRRPVFGGTKKFQNDPYWRDYPLFYEYFHGDNGAGLGASHQTGWTGLIAPLMCLFAELDPHEFLEHGHSAVRGAREAVPERVGSGA